MKKTLLILFTSLVGASSLVAGDMKAPIPPQAASYIPPQSDWEFEAILYGWAAGIDGTTGVGGLTSQVDVGFEDILDELDMGAMFALGVRKGRIGFRADFLYLDVRPSYETPGPLFGRTDLNLQETMLDLKGSFRVAEWNGGFFEVLGGARYMNVDIELEFQPGLLPYRSARGNDHWWDVVGGFRAQHHLTQALFLTAYADIGAGESDLTWQALGGIGYRFTNNVHATLGYRVLDYDYTNDGFTFDLSTQGVILGVGLTW